MMKDARRYGDPRQRGADLGHRLYLGLYLGGREGLRLYLGASARTTKAPDFSGAFSKRDMGLEPTALSLGS